MASEQTIASVAELLRRKENEYERRGWDNMKLHLFNIMPIPSVFGTATENFTMNELWLPEHIACGGAGVGVGRAAAYFEGLNGLWDKVQAGLPPEQRAHRASGFAFFSESWSIDAQLRNRSRPIADTVGAKECRFALAVLGDGTIIKYMRTRGEAPIQGIGNIADDQVGLVGALWILTCATNTNTVDIPQNFGWSRDLEKQETA
jgi:hypothetical protein